MNCPNCEKELLKEIVFNNTAVDYCPKCLGLWFDEDELRQAKDEKDKGLNWLDIDLWEDEKKFCLGQGRKVCPKDAVPLYEVGYGNSGIRVDICEQCRGIWLDRGEFKKIIAYLKNKGNLETLNNYFANFVAEGIEVFTGPETLKEEFADFVSLLKVLNYKFLVQHPYLASAIMSLPK